MNRGLLAVALSCAIFVGGRAADASESKWTDCGTASAALGAVGGALSSLSDKGSKLGAALGSLFGSSAACDLIEKLTASDQEAINDVETQAAVTGKPASKSWESDSGEELTYEVKKVEPVPVKSEEVASCSKVTGVLTSSSDEGAVSENVACVNGKGEAVDSANMF